MTPNQAFDQWFRGFDEIGNLFAKKADLMRQAFVAGAAHGASSRTPDWQPMDTAPKDGTSVLLTDGQSIHVAYWGSYRGWPYDNQLTWLIPDTEMSNDEGVMTHVKLSLAPTGWMPLPSP